METGEEMKERIEERDAKAKTSVATLVTTHNQYGKDIDACGNVRVSSVIYFKRLVGEKANHEGSEPPGD